MSWKNKSDLFREAKGHGLDVAVGSPNGSATDSERIMGGVEDVHDGIRTVTIHTRPGFVTLKEGDVGKIEIVIPEGAIKPRRH